jgi:hypothetical protein
VKQTTRKIADRPLGRNNDACVMPPLPDPLGVPTHEMGNVKRDNHSAFVTCPLQLGLVGFTQASGFWC